METEQVTPTLMLFTLIAVVVIAAGSFLWFLRKRENRELAARAFEGGTGPAAGKRNVMYEIHSTKRGVPQAIKRPNARSALGVATQRAMDGHDGITVNGSDGRSFTLEEFGIEAGGSVLQQRDETKRVDVLDRHSDVQVALPKT